MANEYSKSWFEIFMNNKSNIETELEAQFIMRNAPVSGYKKVLDLCCGQGRHSKILADNGYNVIGIDRNIAALEYAKNHCNNNAAFIEHDMRDIESLNQQFNVIISMWQSFGYFEDEVNKNIIKQVSKTLLPHGLFVLDIYNKECYENNIGISKYNKNGIDIVSEIKKDGNRFNVKLEYSDAEETVEEFNWRLYTKDEIINICKEFGLVCKIDCTWCDESKSIDNNSVRMQLIFEKR